MCYFINCVMYLFDLSICLLIYYLFIHSFIHLFMYLLIYVFSCDIMAYHITYHISHITYHISHIIYIYYIYIYIFIHRSDWSILSLHTHKLMPCCSTVSCYSSKSHTRQPHNQGPRRTFRRDPSSKPWAQRLHRNAIALPTSGAPPGDQKIAGIYACSSLKVWHMFRSIPKKKAT